MEPPPSSTASSSSKLRLMCSYGGHIVPRPRSNSLRYAGGDTRIVSVDRRAVTTLDSLLSHLSLTLSLNFSFTLKYQLPHLDLDSLISLTSDDDFQILVDEHDRLSSAPTPSRIRVFLFPCAATPGLGLGLAPGKGKPAIRHPKTEAWFFDALKGAKIVMQKGLAGEAHGYGYGAGGEAHGLFPPGPESVVLETTSSYGSTSSSASFTNLPSLKAQSEDNVPTNSVLSDHNSVSNIVPHHHHQNISYQDPIFHASSMETRAQGTEETIKLESKVPNNTNLELGAYNNTSSSSFPLHSNQVQMQHLQFVQPLHHHHQHHLMYHPNQSYPIYFVPLGGQIPQNNFASLNQNSSFMTTSHPFAPMTPNNSAATSFVHVPPTQVVYQQSQTVSMASRESPRYGNEHDDGGELDRVQIYKSQPPPPVLNPRP